MKFKEGDIILLKSRQVPGKIFVRDVENVDEQSSVALCNGYWLADNTFYVYIDETVSSRDAIHYTKLLSYDGRKGWVRNEFYDIKKIS